MKILRHTHLGAVHRFRLREVLSERGSIEASLILIPLLILFLTGMQIAATSHLRNIEKMHAQNLVSVRAISGNFRDADQFIHIDSSGDRQNLDLLVTHRERGVLAFLPSLAQILGRAPSISVEGIAIVENQR